LLLIMSQKLLRSHVFLIIVRNGKPIWPVAWGLIEFVSYTIDLISAMQK
jgi:hypothetical protein